MSYHTHLLTNFRDALEQSGAAISSSSDDSIRSQCPSCRGSSTDKLAVDAEGDKLLVSCFGGCSTADIVQSLGMTEADLFERTTDNARRNGTHERRETNNKISRPVDQYRRFSCALFDPINAQHPLDQEFSEKDAAFLQGVTRGNATPLKLP